jgi:non-heme chloroperoxidase
MTSCRLSVITVLLAGVVPSHIAATSERFPDNSPHSERFVIGSGGTRLHVLDWGGSGPLLLFLPGLGQTAHIFDSLAPQFRDRCHVVGLTRRGHGRSNAPAGNTIWAHSRRTSRAS